MFTQLLPFLKIYYIYICIYFLIFNTQLYNLYTFNYTKKKKTIKTY